MVSHAQQKDHRIAGMADPGTDKIRLRWSPASYITWEMGNKYGYTVERFTIAVNGELVSHPQPVMLTDQPLTPYTLQQMKTAADRDERVSVIAELIYGEGVEKLTPEAGIGAYFENQNKNDWRMAMALLSCDLSVAAAKSAGLYLEDFNVKKGERYVYRIALARQPSNMVIDTAIVVASLDAPMLLAPPRELAIVCADSTVTLGWLTTFNTNMYSAYKVERAADGKTFKPVTELPVLPTGPDKNGFSYYQDSLPDNDHKYTYRVRGITPFGDYGPYSKTVEGIGVAAVSDRPVMDTIIVTDNKKIQLRWLLPGDLSKQLTSVVVTRADNAKGPFVPVATLKSSVLTYTDVKPSGSNYYRIKGVTRAGKALYSFPYFAQVIDTIPPAIPVGLAGRVDSSGIVFLQWDANKEKDLQGYRVFRANGPKEEFVEVSREVLSGTVFTDTITLHTLTSKIYYEIISVDKNYNTSGYTPYVALKRPDTIPPIPPVMTKAFRSDSLHAIVLEWRNSSSADIVKYTLCRITVKDSVRKEVASWDTVHLRDHYTDTALQLGNTYYYELQVSDDSDNKSTELSGDVWFEANKRPAIKTINASVDKEKKYIQLVWQYNQPEVKQYRIFRAKNDGAFILFSTQDGAAKQWTDDEIFLGNVYKYKITAVLKGDVKTEMSKVIEVKY
jgi:fibronectin type 3 domain-containing protein